MILGLVGFLFHAAYVLYSMRSVTLAPEGAIVIDGRGPDWFADEAVSLLVPLYVWMALLGNFAFVFRGWEARRVDRFEREKRRRLLRPRTPRKAWSPEYFVLPQDVVAPESGRPVVEGAPRLLPAGRMRRLFGRRRMLL